MSDLKPCPFCGGVPEYSINTGYADKYILQCRECGAKKTSEYLEMLNDKWNARAIPEGYQLVPIEPTTEMQNAYFDELKAGAHRFDNNQAGYKAMLKAASIEEGE